MQMTLPYSGMCLVSDWLLLAREFKTEYQPIRVTTPEQVVI